MTTPQSPIIKGKFSTCKITRREDLTEDLLKIWLETSDPFNFKPGQYCTIGKNGIERPYSIVSSPDEKEIELFNEVVPPPDGNLTPIIQELDIGEDHSGIMILEDKLITGTSFKEYLNLKIEKYNYFI